MVKTHIALFTTGLLSLCFILASCASLPERMSSRVYYCDQGTQLNVDYFDLSYTLPRGGRGQSLRHKTKPYRALVTINENLKVELRYDHQHRAYSNNLHQLKFQAHHVTWQNGTGLEEICMPAEHP